MLWIKVFVLIVAWSLSALGREATERVTIQRIASLEDASHTDPIYVARQLRYDLPHFKLTPKVKEIIIVSFFLNSNPVLSLSALDAIQFDRKPITDRVRTLLWYYKDKKVLPPALTLEVENLIFSPPFEEGSRFPQTLESLKNLRMAQSNEPQKIRIVEDEYQNFLDVIYGFAVRAEKSARKDLESVLSFREQCSRNFQKITQAFSKRPK